MTFPSSSPGMGLQSKPPPSRRRYIKTRRCDSPDCQSGPWPFSSDHSRSWIITLAEASSREESIATNAHVSTCGDPRFRVSAWPVNLALGFREWGAVSDQLEAARVAGLIGDYCVARANIQNAEVTSFGPVLPSPVYKIYGSPDFGTRRTWGRSLAPV
ncbi:uncharacterized protein LY79DRAFT_563596, partial [Colletotrichum navitas]